MPTIWRRYTPAHRESARAFVPVRNAARQATCMRMNATLVTSPPVLGGDAPGCFGSGGRVDGSRKTFAVLIALVLNFQPCVPSRYWGMCLAPLRLRIYAILAQNTITIMAPRTDRMRLPV